MSQYAALTDSFWNSYSKVTPIERNPQKGFLLHRRGGRKSAETTWSEGVNYWILFAVLPVDIDIDKTHQRDW